MEISAMYFKKKQNKLSIFLWDKLKTVHDGYT